MSKIFVTFDGDTHWLECFAEDQDAEHGEVLRPLDAGDTWEELLAAVAAHRTEHGCSQEDQ